MRLSTNKLSIFSTIAFALLWTACQQPDDSAGDQQSRMNVRLTDAPAPYDAVNVEIVGVEVHTDAQGWVSLNMPVSGVYNLLDFTNGLDTLIASSALPSGKMSQIRLVLGNNNSLEYNGNTYDLFVPSGSKSGLKVQVHKTLLPGITYEILLDFDAAKSIVQTGNNKYILKPVLRTITNGLDGVISGEVSPITQAVVLAISNGDTTGSFTDSTGGFSILGLAGGTYQVDILPAAPYSDTTLTGVSVTVGQITDVGTINVN